MVRAQARGDDADRAAGVANRSPEGGHRRSTVADACNARMARCPRAEFAATHPHIAAPTSHAWARRHRDICARLPSAPHVPTLRAGAYILQAGSGGPNASAPGIFVRIW